ncbi:MAG: helix-hairpin-helix domain-containing protein [Deltaproteobacteria bacterium]|nr:helix-hairpin-helix domain-containing protein [Deltaproteobacteria bacterium]
METTRALVGVVLVAVAAGVVVSWPRSGELPAPCARPALQDGSLVCDGDGDDVGDRAWLLGARLDLNRTSARSLERISGIGPSLAEKIIAERDRRGGFAHIEDVDDVDGVGPKLLAKISAVVEVREVPRQVTGGL